MNEFFLHVSYLRACHVSIVDSYSIKGNLKLAMCCEQVIKDVTILIFNLFIFLNIIMNPEVDAYIVSLFRTLLKAHQPYPSCGS